MKKTLCIIALICAALPATAGLDLQYDERGNIILNQEICTFAQESLTAISVEINHAQNAQERAEAEKKLKTFTEIVARCVEQNFIETY